MAGTASPGEVWGGMGRYRRCPRWRGRYLPVATWAASSVPVGSPGRPVLLVRTHPYQPLLAPVPSRLRRRRTARAATRAARPRMVISAVRGRACCQNKASRIPTKAGNASSRAGPGLPDCQICEMPGCPAHTVQGPSAQPPQSPSGGPKSAAFLICNHRRAAGPTSERQHAWR